MDAACIARSALARAGQVGGAAKMRTTWWQPDKLVVLVLVLVLVLVGHTKWYGCS